MFRKISEGVVYSTRKENYFSSGSRTARLPDGRYICAYNRESASGANDFVPMISYSDNGENWGEPFELWPEFVGKKSISISVRNTDDGRVCICGWSAEIAYAGENWWDDDKCAMKENQLVFTISKDGYEFPRPTFLDLPYYGAAEIPGGMHVDSKGDIYIVYSPYRTIEACEDTDVNCLVMLRSTDGGKTFEASKIAEVSGESQYAETWIAELASGDKMITTWQTASADAPDQYLYSKDGKSFSGPHPLPFKGQTTALTPLPDGRVMIAYNQRKEAPIGIWVAVARPDENGLNLIENTPVWQAKTAGTGADFSDWTSFSYGEPHILEMHDGNYLLVYWFEQDGEKGIGYTKLKYEENSVKGL